MQIDKKKSAEPKKDGCTSQHKEEGKTNIPEISTNEALPRGVSSKLGPYGDLY